MSILLEHTVVSAKFDNPEQTMIAVMLADPDREGEAFEYNIDALDHEHEDYKALVFDCGWDLERIQKETLAVNQANYQLFRQAMQNEYKMEIARLKMKHQAEMQEAVAKYKPTDSNNVVSIVDILDNNNNEEMLFQSKLALFDRPEVDALSKAKKANIRKAKSLMELFGAVSDVKWDNNS